MTSLVNAARTGLRALERANKEIIPGGIGSDARADIQRGIRALRGALKRELELEKRVQRMSSVPNIDIDMSINL